MNNPETSTWPNSAPIGGMITSSTSEDTIFPKAAPTITPTAKSTTLPRMANSLNSLSMGLLLYYFDEGQRQPWAESQSREGLFLARIISEANNTARAQTRGVDLRRPLLSVAEE